MREITGSPVALSRIGAFVLAAVLAGTGVFMTLHLACHHDEAAAGSHPDCKICKKYSHCAAILLLTHDAPGSGPAQWLDGDFETTVQSWTVSWPEGRAPPPPQPFS